MNVPIIPSIIPAILQFLNYLWSLSLEDRLGILTLIVIILGIDNLAHRSLNHRLGELARQSYPQP